MNQAALTFYSVLNHSDIGRHFCNYLKKEKKEETWKFVVATSLLEVLVQKSNTKKSTTQIKQIMKQFFQKNQVLQLKESMVPLYKQILVTENFDQLLPLLVELKNQLVFEYEHYEFKSFIQTPESRKLCLTYEKNKLLVVSTLSNEFRFTDENFETYITKRDLEFYRKFEKESVDDWDTNSLTEGNNMWYSYLNYFPGVSFLVVPQTCRQECELNCSFQEALIGILHNYFQNDSFCIFYRTVDFQKDFFIVEQYMHRPPLHVRVRRMVCTLIYENDSVLCLIKPIKIPHMSFVKFQEMKFFKKGKEVVERGVQDFFYYGFRIIKISEKKSKFISNCVVHGVSGTLGYPKTIIVKKAIQFFKLFTDGIKMADGKLIKDFKEEFNELKYGLPINPFAKMLYDLNEVIPSELKSPTKYIKLGESKNLMDNILSTVLKQSSPTIKEEPNILQKITENIVSVISPVKSESLKKSPSREPENEPAFIGNISDLVGSSLESKNVEERLEGELISNISKNYLQPTDFKNEYDFEISAMNLTCSDFELTEGNEDCLTDILNDGDFLEELDFVLGPEEFEPFPETFIS
jgi:hypothetical protein